MKKQMFDGVKAAVFALLFGVLFGGVLAVLLLIPCAVLMGGGKLEEEMMPLLTMAACFLGALLGALLAWRRLRARALLLGVGTAVLQFLLFALLGCLCFGTPNWGNQALSLFLAALLGGLLGGICRLLKKNRRK